MSYQLSYIAAKTTKSKMLRALRRATEELGGTYFDDPNENYRSGDKYHVYEIKGWCVCLKGLGLFPDLEIQVSKQLDEIVLGFDTYEVVGYTHISAIEKGRTKFVFTYHDGILDDEGIDWKKMLEKAVETKAFRFLAMAPGEDVESERIKQLQYSPEIVFRLQFGVNDELIIGSEDGVEITPIYIDLPRQCAMMGEKIGVSWRDIIGKK